ncbi:hypothetical protein F5Y03DRAFT_156703 [Xylaria venustula]|nr:hypothetical protein F5Y03DRAFT_156703 [Xylaria venustula]
MEDDGRFDDHCRYESNGRIHEWTSEIFTKYKLPHVEGPTDDDTDRASTLPSLPESTIHEAIVYRLLDRCIDIPVPKKISSGFDDAGGAYIRIERTEETVRASGRLVGPRWRRCCGDKDLV